MNKRGKSTQIVRLIHLFESILLLALLALLFYLSRPVDTPKNLLLPHGATSAIISQLQERKIPVGKLDVWLLRLLGEPESGWVYLGRRRMNRLDFLHRLGSANSRFKRVTLIPGETTPIFLDQLAKTLDLNRTRLQIAFDKQSPYPEAGILAESYNVPLHYDEKQVINYLTNLTKKRYRKMARQAGLDDNRSAWERILTVASIVQKEAANRKEMPLVASVIYNRLKKHMRLQMDGTLNYGRYSHVKVTPRRIRDDNSSYNTYKHRGLPPAPVCNVSATAIRSALFPAKSDYLYFIRNDRGTHDFSTSYRKHLQKVRLKRREIRQERRRKEAKEKNASSPNVRKASPVKRSDSKRSRPPAKK